MNAATSGCPSSELVRMMNSRRFKVLKLNCFLRSNVIRLALNGGSFYLWHLYFGSGKVAGVNNNDSSVS